MSNPKVFVKKIKYSSNALNEFIDKYQHKEAECEKYLLNYPTVYIVNHSKRNKYNVYVGETSDIYQRTIQHLEADKKCKEDWKTMSSSDDATMYIIGHEYFNKSLTLDIENRLMSYLTTVESIDTVYNRRTNPQNEYYTSEHLDTVFSQIWRKLRQFNKCLFPLEKHIRDSALFKASPFHKLTVEQIEAKESIKENIISALKSNERGKLILVTGAAGSGKTVLLSSLFYELCQDMPELFNIANSNETDSFLLVNHNEQLTIYEQIAEKLNLHSKKKPRVMKPTAFINKISIDNPIDVSLIDEAHLLWTTGNQSYRGKNQLWDIIDRSKVTVAVFDQDQILQTNQVWEDSMYEKIKNIVDVIIPLTNQMRINANEETISWIRNFIDNREIDDIPDDSKYDLKIFNSPSELEEAIREKAMSTDNGISRIIATYDWPYSSNRSSNEGNKWMVYEDDWAMPWNLEYQNKDKGKFKINKKLSWAEQEHTINEVGSTYTVQGSDLNYAGVILGPSVKYKNGKVIFNPDASCNKNAIQNRTLDDGSKKKFGEILTKNEVNVLLTRGVNGLYIYAVDPELRKALQYADRRYSHE